MQNFEKWLPSDTSKAFLIQLKKYYELKFPTLTEDEITLLIEDIMKYINRDLNIEVLKESLLFY